MYMCEMYMIPGKKTHLFLSLILGHIKQQLAGAQPSQARPFGRFWGLFSFTSLALEQTKTLKTPRKLTAKTHSKHPKKTSVMLARPIIFWGLLTVSCISHLKLGGIDSCLSC